MLNAIIQDNTECRFQWFMFKYENTNLSVCCCYYPMQEINVGFQSFDSQHIGWYMADLHSDYYLE
jgi:hypothetical protein